MATFFNRESTKQYKKAVMINDIVQMYALLYKSNTKETEGRQEVLVGLSPFRRLSNFSQHDFHWRKKKKEERRMDP